MIVEKAGYTMFFQKTLNEAMQAKALLKMSYICFTKIRIMIRSMTGFGKAIAEIADRKISVEIRTLNSKQLDINTRIPQIYREKEGEIRSEISKILERGKIDVVLSFDNVAEASDVSISHTVAQKYYKEIISLAKVLDIPVGSDILPSILSMPDVIKTDKVVFDENEWLLVKRAVVDAISQTDDFRKNEGMLTGNEMKLRVNNIMSLLSAVEPFEKARISILRERFRRNQEEFFEAGSKSDKFDENRFEQEIFWYLEKLDITEEKVRLAKHCEYFIETMSSADSNGRKLGFITQEIGREINTLGSKAADADMQKIVVQMKDELEKIKEQVGNIL